MSYCSHGHLAKDCTICRAGKKHGWPKSYHEAKQPKISQVLSDDEAAAIMQAVADAIVKHNTNAGYIIDAIDLAAKLGDYGIRPRFAMGRLLAQMEQKTVELEYAERLRERLGLSKNEAPDDKILAAGRDMVAASFTSFARAILSSAAESGVSLDL